MQRFYCTVCKKVKRVRKLPSNVANERALFAEDRIGQCKRHTRLHVRRPETLKVAGGR